MNPSPPHRLGILSGVVFVALVLVAFIALGGDTPDIDGSGQKVASYYTAHSSREQAAAYVLGIACLFGALFVVHLWSAVRSAGVDSAWTALVVVGGAVAVGGFLFSAAMHLVLADAADKGYSAEQLRLLNAIDADDYLPMAEGLALFVLGGGAALLRSGLAPKWLAWVGIVLGLVTFTPLGFVGFGLSGLWIIVISVLLFLRLAPGAEKGAPPAAVGGSAG
jgi:hypothetical protein